MKAIFTSIAVDKAGTAEQRDALQALRGGGMTMLNKPVVMAGGMADLLHRFPDPEAESHE